MIRRAKGIILDLDGTVYLGDHLIPGADAAVRYLRDTGRRVVFLTNKPLETRQSYAAKLTRLGVPAIPDDIVTSAWVLANHLADREPGARLYVIGEPPLVDELSCVGLQLSDDPAETDYVVVAFDRGFHYDKLNFALQAFKHGARFIVTNPDRTCPTADGEIPDAAGMIGAVEGVTGVKITEIVGKPSPIMVRVILSHLGLAADQCLMIGDRLETDIRMGREAGIATALVLTGVTTREDLARSAIQPDYVLNSIAELPALVEKSG